MGYQEDIIVAFAQKAKSLGFTVYLSKSKTYGAYTDNTGKRVVSFQYDISGEIKFSGNYMPSRESGTGWAIGSLPADETQDALQRALDCPAPYWAHKNPIYRTMEQYLDCYKTSSGFEQV